ncbi:MAG: hypothetical protein RR602_09315 [Longicatena sp.]|uniref:hypothetical protein n=1 Tax=Anaerorhabdus sp. TaxID=1872524 RepID=UPI002FC7456E
MKIDLHCHTKKTKSGDAETRNVSVELFSKALIDNQVSIAAITNHNVFDYDQYVEFRDSLSKSNIQIWPGVELDVKGKNSKGHCIVISNPTEVNKFNEVCRQMIADSGADEFAISSQSLADNFSKMNVIVIAHYGKKEPSLCDVDINELKEMFGNKVPFFLEVSNLRSAGILYAHNMNSFIGSDIQDWKKYNESELPELKMPIVDYSHFCLLVKKDPKIIKTFLDQKKSDEFKIKPFEDEINLNIYNDINVIFGGKGTGKSKILESIKEHYDSLGNSDVSYYNGQTKESDFKKITGIVPTTNEIENYDVASNTESIAFLKEWKDVTIITMDKYIGWINTKDVNVHSKKFGFREATFGEVLKTDLFEKKTIDYQNIKSALDAINNIDDIDNYLKEEELEQFRELLDVLVSNIKQSVLEEWIKVESLKLEKFTIDKMKSICTTKSGVNPLPSNTGLLELYNNSLELKQLSDKIIVAFSKPKKEIKVSIGSLSEKGSIYIKKELFINPDEKYLKIQSDKKFTITDIKNFKKDIIDLNANAFAPNKGEKISKIVSILSDKEINSMKDLICYRIEICDELGEKYTPSNGEQSMLLLANSLVDENKNIFILDEPELSVGHSYINEVIVPKLIDLSKLGKKVILSTHDANIAVRTLPLQSIYREYRESKYFTYIGSTFTDSLSNIMDDNDTYSWTNKSISTLEGGELAFLERGEIYGK